MKVQGTEVFKAIWGTQKRVNCIRGGTRSSKSYSLTQLAIIWLISGRIGKHEFKTGTFAIVRATFPALRATVLKDFISLLHEYGLYKFVDHRKSFHEFIYRGREVIFFSTDDEHKLKGRKTTIFWLNEADSVPYEHFGQMIRRCSHFCYLDYNPAGEPWLKDKIETDRAKSHKDVFLHVSTYKQNPFLPAEMVREIQELKKTNIDLWTIYTKGQWVKRSGRIFPEVNTFTEFPDVHGSIYWGLDWGFVDPTALVEVRIYEAAKEIYIKELLYQSGVLLTDVSAAIYANSCGRVVCDAADPRSIDELRRRGNRVQASFKGASSVVQGINRILQYKIYINGENALNEFKNYHWKINLSGDSIPVPDKTDPHHSIDAVRYAISYSQRAKIQLIK